MPNSDSDYNVLDTIHDKVQNILNHEFAKERYTKRKIDIFRDRWNFACPICGDSTNDYWKKRGNIYFSTLNFHCYNCGEHMGVNTFLEHFGEKLDVEDKITIHEIQQSAKKFERKRHSSSQSSMSITLLTKVAIPKKILFTKLGIISPYKNEFVSNYLKSRMIPISQWKHFAFKPSTQELYILNISPEDRVIGYQIRQLDPNSRKTRYLSSSLSKIYKEVFDKELSSILEKLLLKEELGQKYIDGEDGMENITANIDRLSGIFNIMNVDISKELTIMEGPIDSLAIPNSIALQGASKHFDGFFDEIDTARYLFDNDKTGKEMSINKLKEHKTVFLWSKYMNLIKTKEKIKDVNDLQKKGLLNKDYFIECFSDDELDVMEI